MTQGLFVLDERIASESIEGESEFGGRYIWADGKTDDGSPLRFTSQQFTVFNQPFLERAARKDAVELLDDFRITARHPHALRPAEERCA